MTGDLHYVARPEDLCYSTARAACGASRVVHSTTVIGIVTCAGCLAALAEDVTQATKVPK